jgi:hypothetical protein
LDPQTHYYLSEAQLAIAEKFLREIYPFTGNRSDNFHRNENLSEVNQKNRNMISDVAKDLGKNFVRSY